jgi:hypothetical protein
VKPLAFVLVASSMAWAAGASGQTAPAQSGQTGAEYTYPVKGVDHSRTMWRVEMGYRGSFVTNAGYNPFSTDDYFSQFSVAASRTLLTEGRLSFAPGVSWDYGSAGASARGDGTSFSMQRITVPLEGRFHLGSWGYAFVRGAPGVALQRVEVDESTSPAPLAKTAWQFATDVSAGYAWLAWRGSSAGLEPGLWLQGDAGYGWVAGERLSLAADLPSSSPQGDRVSGIDLGTLTMRGAFFRLAAAVSF